MTHPNGLTCMVATGQAWENVEKVALGPAAKELRGRPLSGANPSRPEGAAAGGRRANRKFEFGRRQCKIFLNNVTASRLFQPAFLCLVCSADDFSVGKFPARIFIPGFRAIFG